MPGFVIDSNLLSLAAKRNGYFLPIEGYIFFGIRGAVPEIPSDNTFSDRRTVSFSDIDFKKMNCTFGQWDVSQKRIALFPGSTVPSQINIARARTKAGSGTNMLMPGRYLHVRGIHKNGKPGAHRAFRQASFQPVWRTADNLSYDLSDRLDLGKGSGDFVWDNIHSAYTDRLDGAYSSAGCQVICGLPQRGGANETGPWASFIKNAYFGTAQIQFVYLLFTASELATLQASNTASLTQIVRFGSSGPLATAVQQALIDRHLLEPAADGTFGRNSLRALIEFQTQTFGANVADGICGTTTAAALGVPLPNLDLPAALPEPLPPASATSEPLDLEDETDLAPEVIRQLFPILGLESPVPASAPPNEGAEPAASPSRVNFERAQAIIKDFEGGYSDDAKDPGGATNFGITLATLKAWRNRPTNKSDVANLSYSEAKDIYFDRYWQALSCGSMPGPLALVVYNVGIHAGVGTSSRYLQRSLCASGLTVEVDGGIGGETLGAVSKAAASGAVLSEIIDDMIDLYESKLRSHPDFEHFKKGFLQRVQILRSKATQWMAEDGHSQPVVSTPTLITQEEGAMNSPKMDAALDFLDRFGFTKQLPLANGQNASASVASALRKLADEIDPPSNSSSTPQKPQVLTPINAALGQTIGTALDGKKTAIGILGSIASYLVSSPDIVQAIPALGGVAEAVGSGTLPVFLGTTVWGLLGKFEKLLASAQQRKN